MATETAKFTVRALDANVVALECSNEYTRSKPSFMVTDPVETHAEAESSGAGQWTLRTETLFVEAQESPPRLRIYRTTEKGDDLVCELNDLSPEGASVDIDRGFALYGLGGRSAEKVVRGRGVEPLKSIQLDRRGDVYRIHHRETGQGNNNMPWVLSSQGFGLFFDSSFPMTIDLRDRFAVEGKNIRTFYFINGPTTAEALGRFVKLTGLPPMHPAWALGYEQSSRTWMNPGELDFVTTYFREKHIPCDGFVLLSTYGGDGGVGNGRGIHEGYLDLYQGWNVKGTYGTYNPNLLPNGGADIQKLRDQGFHPIVHGYWPADYSDPEATEKVWQDQKYLAEDGFEGWWLDGTESVRVHQNSYISTEHLPEGEKLEMEEFQDEYDNVWAVLRAKAFYEKQRRDFPQRRVYILNRAVFPGAQKYAAGVNQGDYWVSWELMKIQTIWLLNMQMSGIMFPETDIAGHWASEELDQEIFIRWAFMGTFGPLMRSHGHAWRCRLPWGFGPENEARFVPLIRLRSAMFPYNYTLLSQANQQGIPMMRAMAMEFPDDLQAREVWDQFMWGPNMLVAPVYQKGATERQVYLPEGSWVHYWTLESFSGPGTVTVDAPLGRDPLFLKAGSIVPMRQWSDTIPTEADDRLVLLASPAKQEGSFTLYDDDRQTYGYEEGESSQQTFRISAIGDSGSFDLDIGAVEGDHDGVKKAREYRIEIPRSLATVGNASVSGQEVPIESLPDRYVLELDSREGPVRIEFR
jgi:alpha-glucosidase